MDKHWEHWEHTGPARPSIITIGYNYDKVFGSIISEYIRKLLKNDNKYLLNLLLKFCEHCIENQVSLVELIKTKAFQPIIDTTNVFDKSVYRANRYYFVPFFTDVLSYVNRYDSICNSLVRGPIELDIQKQIVYYTVVQEMKDDRNLVIQFLTSLLCDDNIRYYEWINNVVKYTTPIINVSLLVGAWYLVNYLLKN